MDKTQNDNQSATHIQTFDNTGNHNQMTIHVHTYKNTGYSHPKTPHIKAFDNIQHNETENTLRMFIKIGGSTTGMLLVIATLIILTYMNYNVQSTVTTVTGEDVYETRMTTDSEKKVLEAGKEEYNNRTEDSEKELQVLEAENLKEECYNCTEGYNQLMQSTCTQRGCWSYGGHSVNDTFNTVISKAVQRDNKYQMYNFTNWPVRMSVIKDMLWIPFVENRFIKIFDPKSEYYYKTYSQIRFPFAVRETNSNQVLVSSMSGLHVLSVTGSYLYEISGGHFYGISIRCDVAYVYRTTRIILIVTQNNGVWDVNGSFPVSSGSWTSLEISKDTLYVCSWRDNIISTYTLNGTCIRIYGKPGSKSPGQLLDPYLCGVDSEGSLLVCDQNNHRLQVLSRFGTWEVIELPGAVFPRDVVIDGHGNVWFLHGSEELKNIGIVRFQV